MARTAITITEASAYAQAVNITKTAADAVNLNSLALNRPVLLVCLNTNAATVDFTIELPAGLATFNEARSISHTIPAAVGDVAGVRTVWCDVPGNIRQSEGLLHIDSVDANFGDVLFAAIVGPRTPR